MRDRFKTIGGVAFGVTRADPIGDFVDGAVVAFPIAETFGHEQTVAVRGVPAVGQFAQGEAKALGGEIGPAGFFGHEKAAPLHDEFEALRAGDWIPSDHGIAVLEMPSGGTPDEHGDDFVFFEDELAEVSAVRMRSETALGAT